MKRVIASLILFLGLILTTATPSWAADCFASADPPPVANQTFTMKFAGLFDRGSQSYTVRFQNFNKSFSITKSSSNNDGFATVSGGLPATTNNTPYEVVSGTGTVCQGALFISATAPTSSNPGTCQYDSNGNTVVINNCSPGYECQKVRTSPFSSGFSSVCRTAASAGTYCVTNADCPSGQTCTNRACSTTSQTQSNTSGIGTPQLCINTDFGCIPTDPAGLANAIFKIILGVAGGLGILFVIIGGFKVATSQGNPDALEDGRDTITKAITGLAFILLATVILSIIGIDILGLGAFFQRSGGGLIFTP